MKPIFLFHLYLIFTILSQLPGEIFMTLLGNCLLSFLFFLLKISLLLLLVNFLLPHFLTCSSFLDSLNYFLSSKKGLVPLLQVPTTSGISDLCYRFLVKLPWSCSLICLGSDIATGHFHAVLMGSLSKNKEM